MARGDGASGRVSQLSVSRMVRFTERKSIGMKLTVSGRQEMKIKFPLLD